MLQRRRDQPKPEPIPLLILVGKLARNAILPPAPYWARLPYAGTNDVVGRA